MVDFHYQVIRRAKRRTASISVTPESAVRVVVPSRLTEKQIIELVKRKSRWIRSKILFNDEVRNKYKPKEYVSGESFSYLGRNYRLKIVKGEPDQVKLANGRFYVHIPDGASPNEREQVVVSSLANWYQEHALERLLEKSERLSKLIDHCPSSVAVKAYKSRWGSCTSKGIVCFNWKIIMAPHSIVDYVVVHELCHLVHHNHSKEYWKLVERVMPDFRERKEWLRVNGRGLDI